MTSILLTGSTGLLGSHIFEKLKTKKEYKILTLSRKHVHKDHNNHLICDISNRRCVEKIFKNYHIDIVIHTAAQLRKKGVGNEYFYRTNFMGTKNLIDMAIKYKAKQFIHCSTASIIGPVKDRPLDENSESYDLSNPYKHSKYLAEKYVMSKKDEMNITIISPEMIYGPGDKHYLPIYKMVNTGIVPIIGDGNNYHQPTYVEDVSQAFIWSIENKKTYNKKIIIAGKPIRTIEYFRKIGEVLGKTVLFIKFPMDISKIIIFIQNMLGREIINNGVFDFYRINHVYSTKLAKRIFNFKSTPLEIGLRKTIDWYKEVGWL